MEKKKEERDGVGWGMKGGENKRDKEMGTRGQVTGQGERSLKGRGDHGTKEGRRLHPDSLPHSHPIPPPSLQQWLRKEEGRQERRGSSNLGDRAREMGEGRQKG